MACAEEQDEKREPFKDIQGHNGNIVMVALDDERNIMSCLLPIKEFKIYKRHNVGAEYKSR